MENGGRDSIRPSATPEEEALKRNTDCVYFLASPLTCKKGAECEYRHSEGARVNPRDCWYWLNGNCLNPKCSFRHPPLDGLLGTPTTPSAPAFLGEAVSTSQAFPVHASASQISNKQSVPCYYFRNGICSKGGMCPFMHGPAPVPSTNPVLQNAPKVIPPVPENPLTFKRSTWSLNKCTQEGILKTTSDSTAAVVVSSIKSAVESEKLPNNGLAVKTNSTPVQMNVELPSRLQSSSISTGSGNGHSGPPSEQNQALDDPVQNGRESDEFLRESSPGFDVLVDGETEDSGYFHEGAEYASGNADYHHGADYATASNLERDPYEGTGEYDQHIEVHDRYGRELQRFSDKSLERSSVPERRRSRREESPIEIDSSDLRHRLRKQRKFNGSHSSFNSDQRGHPKRDDYRVEEHAYEARGFRKGHLPRNGSISRRLQGRITLPVRASADNPVDLYSRDKERGRSWGRSSPGRPTKYQGRLHDRLSQRAHADFPVESRNLGSLSITRREETGPQKFSSPKSLAELRDSKFSDKSERSARYNSGTLSREPNTRSGKSVGHEETDSCSFEGPKPLSVILKEKRAATSRNEGSDKIEVPIREKSLADGKEDHQPLSNQREPEIGAAEQEGLIPAVGEEHQHIGSSAKDDDEMEDEVIVDDVEDAGFENYDGEEEYYYEEVEGEDYKIEDDGNMYEENLADGEGDDFSTEVGAMLS